MRRFIFYLLLVGTVFISLTFLRIWMVQQRDHARTLNLSGRFAQIELALRAYHLQHQAFPPPRLETCQGHAHSWRVLLLPYLELEEVYARYRFDEPWNSPHNIALAESLGEAPQLFRSPFGARGPSMSTDFLGAADGFDLDTVVQVFSVSAGGSSFEIGHAPNSGIHWMAPCDKPKDRRRF